VGELYRIGHLKIVIHGREHNHEAAHFHVIAGRGRGARDAWIFTATGVVHASTLSTQELRDVLAWASDPTITAYLLEQWDAMKAGLPMTGYGK
jgi:Domain of unknown function (DUF4160)